MTRLGEPHPEDLLRLDQLNRLSDEQSRDLRLHFESCAACAAQSLTRGAFRRELAARPADTGLDQLAADRALSALASERVGRVHRPRIWRWVALTMPFAALVAASPWLAREATEVTQSRRAKPDHVAVSMIEGASSRMPQPAAPSEAPPIRAPGDDDLPSTPMGATRPPNQKAEGTRAILPGAGEDAAELFRRGAELRQLGARERALALFRRLQDRYPDSREAQLSYVVAGRLLLELGQNAAATSEFGRYLAAGGPAAEEALTGLATALDRLGRFEEERGTWVMLLQRFPDSVQGRRARQRIRELEGR